jgi:hypothetical protein
MERNIFSDVDRVKGEISSQFPAFYYDSNVEKLKESISTQKWDIKNGGIPAERINDARNKLQQEELRLGEIERTKPSLSPGERDKLWKLRGEMTKLIQPAQFTYSEMNRNITNAGEEARRMKQPCIDLTKEMLALAESCNVRVTEGKVGRDGLEKMWKIASKILGEGTNVEALRRDKITLPSARKIV